VKCNEDKSAMIDALKFIERTSRASAEVVDPQGNFLGDPMANIGLVY
jgi:hypothetical protein